MPKEALEAFFRRTASTWVTAAGLALSESGGVVGGKDLRRAAFGLARARYEELWPMLEEMNELEAEQEKMEAMGKAKAAARAPKRGGPTAASPPGRGPRPSRK